MKKCLIISGGKFEKIKLSGKYDFVIACDKGYLYANKINIKPDIIVGDFDSAKMPSETANIIAVDSVKDDTDTGLAIKYALRNGYKDIDIIFALGGRIDHSFANIYMMKYIVEHNGVARILSKNITLVAVGKGKIKIKNDRSKYLSVFSLSDKSKVAYIKGTKYDVKNIILRSNFPLGVSNEFEKDFAEIKIESGVVLIATVK